MLALQFRQCRNYSFAQRILQFMQEVLGLGPYSLTVFQAALYLANVPKRFRKHICPCLSSGCALKDSSFYQALQVADGILLLLAFYFSKFWHRFSCCWETRFHTPQIHANPAKSSDLRLRPLLASQARRFPANLCLYIL